VYWPWLTTWMSGDEELDELEELEEAVDEPPPVEPPVGDLLPPLPLDVLPLDELLVLDDALVVPVPDTVSPTSPESETIVPSSGAYSFVSCTACSSLCTVSLSLFTAALAEARFASRVAALCLVVEPVPLVPCPEEFVSIAEPLELFDFELDVGMVGVVFAACVVVVCVGMVEAPVVVVEVPVPAVVVEDLGEVCVGVVAAVKVVLATVLVAAVDALVTPLLADPWLELVSPSVSSSFARFASAD